MEIRVTVEVLDSEGRAAWTTEPVLAEHDEASLQGDVEAAVDAALEWIEGELDARPETLEPEDGDYMMTDARGGGIAISIHGEGFLQTEPDRDAAERFIALHQLASNWFPNVWFVSDHGNAHLVILPSQVERAAKVYE